MVYNRVEVNNCSGNLELDNRVLSRHYSVLYVGMVVQGMRSHIITRYTVHASALRELSVTTDDRVSGQRNVITSCCY